MAANRFRNFATIVYPESAPENWREILIEQFVPAFISPLHNQDVNPDDEMKKEHYHVMIMYEGPKTTEQAKALFDLIGGVGCKILQSLRGYARYLCHLDNPEKAQYPIEDVEALCGADYHTVISLVTDKYIAIREMISYCHQEGIVLYCDLLEYCMMDRPEWFRVLCDNGTYVVKEYLKSKSYALSKIHEQNSEEE